MTSDILARYARVIYDAKKLTEDELKPKAPASNSESSDAPP